MVEEVIMRLLTFALSIVITTGILEASCSGPVEIDGCGDLIYLDGGCVVPDGGTDG